MLLTGQTDLEDTVLTEGCSLIKTEVTHSLSFTDPNLKCMETGV